MAMYHFVFEMRAVIGQLKSNDPYEYLQKAGANRKLKWLVMVVAFFNGIAYVGFRTYMNDGGEFSLVTDIFYIASVAIKGVLDFATLLIFITCFNYFYQRKHAALKRRNLYFTGMHFFIIYSIYTMVVMRVVSCLIQPTIGILQLTEYRYHATYTNLRSFHNNIFIPIRDLIEVLFFCYLFYFQSGRKQKIMKDHDIYRLIGMKGLVLD